MIATMEQVRPLLTGTKIQDQTLQCSFKCPASGKVVNLNGQLYGGSQSVAGSIARNAAERAKSNVMWSLSSMLGTFLRGIFGNSLLGRAAGDAVSGAAYSAGSQMNQKTDMSRGGLTYSQDEQDQAMLRAFNESNAFAWSDQNKRFEAK